VSGSLSPGIIGRLAGLLFVASGLFTTGYMFLPIQGVLSRPGVITTCAVAIVVGLAAFFAPWDRWPPAATVGLIPIAFALIATGNYFGTSEPYTFGVFFIVAFAWLGLGQPRGAALWCAPLAPLPTSPPSCSARTSTPPRPPRRCSPSP
jgi:hypothetical protein